MSISYRNNDISCTHVGLHICYSRESFEKNCNLVRLGVYFRCCINFFLNDPFV